MNGAALAALKERLLAPVQAVPTPWPTWNQACKGWGGEVGLARGWHVLIAGMSGGAKTFSALNLAAAALRHGETVTFHSLEMGWDELAARVLAIVSGEPAYRLGPGKHFSPERFDAAHEKMDEVRGALVVNEDPMYRLGDLVRGMERCVEEHGSRVQIVDYLQLAWTGDAATMYDRVTEVSHAVRAAAKKLGITTIGLSQLNRETSKAKGERPSKEGMIGGSSLENDADQVLLLDHSRRSDVFSPEGRPRGWTGWLNLDKNRHGPNAEVPIRFDPDTFRIRERMPDEIFDGELRTDARRTVNE
jgi:replicative DNA helicase